MKRDPVALILKAAQFAAHKHSDQRRKGAKASPYINHPIALANVLRNEGGVTDSVVIAAALLHDTIEDTETSYEELRGQFGEEVADVVAEVTDTKWLDKKTRKRLQISKAARATIEAKLVKLADKICNLRDIVTDPPGNWSLERRREYFDWAKAVIAESAARTHGSSGDSIGCIANVREPLGAKAARTPRFTPRNLRRSGVD